MNVWIVDDDSSIRWVLEKALTNAHFNCITFSSGQEAIEIGRASCRERV